MQETKLTRAELTDEVALLDGWESFFDFCSLRTGYSGVATFCKEWCRPIAAQRGLVGRYGSSECHLAPEERVALDAEGRCIMTDHGAFVLFNVYIPALSMEDRAEVRQRHLTASHGCVVAAAPANGSWCLANRH